MTRGLYESLELALAIQPELLSAAYLRRHFPPLIRRCLVAVNEARLGKRPERDLSVAIYGNADVPRSTLQRLLTRTQRELEQLTVREEREDSDAMSRLPWLSVLHLYSAGVSAYVSSHDYRSRERLSSVLSAAKDPFLLPLAISSGVLLTLHLAQHDKPSRMLAARDATRKAVENFLDCWEWIGIYAEVLSLARRRYGMPTHIHRVEEISELLSQVAQGGLDDLAPQAQMIVAYCGYTIGQFTGNPAMILEWAHVYKRAYLLVDRDSAAYQSSSTRMFLRAHIMNRSHDQVVPLIEQILADEFKDSTARAQPIYPTFVSWLTDSLMALGRIEEAREHLRRLDASAMRNASENVRQRLIIQRSIVSGLCDDLSITLDRRIVRVAMLRNESASRRASDHAFRLGALIAMLIHTTLQDNSREYTSLAVAEKLLMFLNMHAAVRSCPRTSAVIRLIAIMEQVEHMSVPQIRRAAAIKRQRSILETATSEYDYEIVPYSLLIDRLYGPMIADLLQTARKRTNRAHH